MQSYQRLVQPMIKLQKTKLALTPPCLSHMDSQSATAVTFSSKCPVKSRRQRRQRQPKQDNVKASLALEYCFAFMSQDGIADGFRTLAMPDVSVLLKLSMTIRWLCILSVRLCSLMILPQIVTDKERCWCKSYHCDSDCYTETRLERFAS